MADNKHEYQFLDSGTSDSFKLFIESNKLNGFILNFGAETHKYFASRDVFDVVGRVYQFIINNIKSSVSFSLELGYLIDKVKIRQLDPKTGVYDTADPGTQYYDEKFLDLYYTLKDSRYSVLASNYPEVNYMFLLMIFYKVFVSQAIDRFTFDSVLTEIGSGGLDLLVEP